MYNNWQSRCCFYSVIREVPSDQLISTNSTTTDYNYIYTYVYALVHCEMLFSPRFICTVKKTINSSLVKTTKYNADAEFCLILRNPWEKPTTSLWSRKQVKARFDLGLKLFFLPDLLLSLSLSLGRYEEEKVEETFILFESNWYTPPCLLQTPETGGNSCRRMSWTHSCSRSPPGKGTLGPKRTHTNEKINVGHTLDQGKCRPVTKANTSLQGLHIVLCTVCSMKEVII